MLDSNAATSSPPPPKSSSLCNKGSQSPSFAKKQLNVKKSNMKIKEEISK